MSNYETVIGLEVHAELNTESKIYCSCHNSFGLEVNSQCCPICMGMPGTLPILNRSVVDYAVRMGHALHCSINRICKQDRKNYFYPDLPKAYQISQFDIPLCEHGYVNVVVDGKQKKIGVTRIHIEEDAGKLLHGESFGGTLVDFNRCGVPLIEIVSEPDMRSSAEAKAYLNSIKSILQHLDISDCKMQEGSIRCDVNVSVHKVGEPFGTRCEMKNVNTFSGAVRAIEYEAKRQIELLESGGTVAQETRRWDDAKGESVPLRSKEDAHDYRYFPEPDLLTIVLSQEEVDELSKGIGELPNERIFRFMQQYGLSQEDSTLLIETPEKADLLEATVAVSNQQPQEIVKWILGDISKYLNDTGKQLSDFAITPQSLSDLVTAVTSGQISTTAGKTVLDVILFEERAVSDVIKEKGLAQISDTDALAGIVSDVLAQNEKSVHDFKNGKTNALGYLVGQCMRMTKGKGNPTLMRQLLEEALSK